jgi:Ras-related protein Rab-18
VSPRAFERPEQRERRSPARALRERGGEPRPPTNLPRRPLPCPAPLLRRSDVTRPETFQHLAQWLAEIEMYSPGGGKNVVKLLVGNKCDLEHDRTVQQSEGEAWARGGGMLFLESSAKNADNVKQCFEEVVMRILETPALLTNTQPNSASHRQGVVLKNAPKPEAAKNDGCC